MRPLFLILLFATLSFSQVVTWDPLFPTDDDTITIVFNASEGNKALQGASTVFAHTGVITDKSPNDTYWLYVKANWTTNLPEARMTSIGEDLWQIRFHIRSFYGVPEGETILKLAFVFRNPDGSKIGKTADNQDIFIPVYQGGVNLTLLQPASVPYLAGVDETVPIIAKSSGGDGIMLMLDDRKLTETVSDSLYYEYTVTDYGVFHFTLQVISEASLPVTLQFDIIAPPPPDIAALPAGVRDGINMTGADAVTLVLTAPGKQFVSVVGPFNDWKIQSEYFMKLSPDSTRFWLELNGLDGDTEYPFQYLVDGSLHIADPYTEKVLDPENDEYISSDTYPDLQEYPYGKTTGIVSTFQINKPEYEFTIPDFAPPHPEQLVIYELLVRDFVEEHNYPTLVDSLDYLQRLGVNAIELMPINEFEGNSGWGYNPSFYFAPDKYYGTATQLKEFVDAAHARGIAVIQDMVLNHAYGQCPLFQLYAGDMDDSPWFNATAPHTDYSWGYDFNHSSPYTQAFVDSVLTFWLTEYNVDGFRFDFTRGFTNKHGSSGAYDASRIAILERIANHVWSVDSNAVVILEHLVDDNRELRELSDDGMLLWGNMNHAYCQTSMGYSDGADISWALASTRGWSDDHLVAYMESHDEERVMYKNLQWGNSQGNYNIKNLSTALKRVQAASAFFFTLPGPKMMWMFGELGYDYSIDFNNRLGEKPIRWDYYADPDRRQLYDVMSAIIKLRKSPAFQQGAYTYNLTSLIKTIHIDHDSMHVVILGNFDVKANYIIPNFSRVGTWYDYLSGSALEVEGGQGALLLQPGEFHIYTDVQLEKPVITLVDDMTTETPSGYHLYQNHPNPFNASTRIEFDLAAPGPVQLDIYNINGRHVVKLVDSVLNTGRHSIYWDGTDEFGHGLATGVYFYKVQLNNRQHVKKMLLLK